MWKVLCRDLCVVQTQTPFNCKRRYETQNMTLVSVPIAVCFKLVEASKCDQGTKANGVGEKYLRSGI